MTTLYTYGQTHGCRVAGTGNLSERTLGYFTKWGDGGSDFNIIGELTSFEVMRLGEELGLPLDLVYKIPDDGLSGMSDEEKLTISYADMHKYLRGREDEVLNSTLLKIYAMNSMTQHKREEIPMFRWSYKASEMLPELGAEVIIFDKYGGEHIAMLTETSFYDEELVFEDDNTKDHRIEDIVTWRYA